MDSKWDQIGKLMSLLRTHHPEQVANMTPVDGKVSCMDAMSFLRANSDESVDLVFTDEPYGTEPTALSFSNEHSYYEHVNVDWDGDFPAHMTIPWVSEAARILKPGGMLVNSGFPEWGTTFKEVVRMSGLEFRGTLPWLKPYTGPQIRKINYKSSFEMFWWASKGSVGDTFNFQEQLEMRNWNLETICPKCKIYHPVILSSSYSSADWMDDVEWPEFVLGVNNYGARVNKTQKPEWLARKFLTIHSSRGDVVVDPFCGSGTYLAVAHSMGREVSGCDIRHGQVDSANKRINSMSISLL